MQLDTRAREVIDIGDGLFSERTPMLNLWQELASNFYPARADFTTIRQESTEWAADLHDGFPLICHRELSDALPMMARPLGKQWARLKTRSSKKNEIPSVKRWLEEKSETMFSVMYYHGANFSNATKAADYDWTAFGNAVISCEEIPERTQLLYRSHHLRDVAWVDNFLEQSDTIHRKSRMSLRNINNRWPKTFPDQLRDTLQKTPHAKYEVRHIIMPRGEFDRPKTATPEQRRSKAKFVELYVLHETSTLLAENDLKMNPYVIPRWHLTGASQYAYSPPGIASLPDARQAQVMAMMLRESGEKMLDPPMLAVKEALRSELSLMSGTLTWIDAEYDERTGDAVRPLQEIGDFSAGINIREDLRGILTQAWYLNKLTLPQGKEMTAFETAKRIEEYLRAVVPLVQPYDSNYSAPLLDLTASMCVDVGAFGRPDEWPEEIQGEELEFEFENAIQAAKRERAAQGFSGGLQLLSLARTINPQAGADMDVDKGLAEARAGVGWSEDWNLDETEAEDAKETAGEQAEAAQVLQIAQQGGAAAESVGSAAKLFGEASAMGQAA